MSLTGITPNVTTELNNLLGKTAFQISKNKESTIEKTRPQQLDKVQAESLTVNISKQAQELSNLSNSQSLFSKT